MDETDGIDQSRTEELLEENLRVTRENNQILHKIHRSIVWGRMMRVAYFVILIGMALGAFYFLQPYLETLIGSYSGAVEAFQSFQ